MKRLIVTVGLPRAGKSTWARTSGYPIVNPDSIRLALHGQAYLAEAEPMVWVIAQYMVEALFIAGHETVVVDATNLTKKRRTMWAKYNPEFKIFDTPRETCIRRAANDNRSDLIPVIKKMDRTKEPVV